MTDTQNKIDMNDHYFVFLSATLALIMSTGVLIGWVVEAKKREKGIYPRRGF